MAHVETLFVTVETVLCPDETMFGPGLLSDPQAVCILQDVRINGRLFTASLVLKRGISKTERPGRNGRLPSIIRLSLCVIVVFSFFCGAAIRICFRLVA